MAEYMIVKARSARIHEPKPAAARQPMLLGVVVSEILAVIKAELSRIVKMQAVVAPADKSGPVVSHGKEVSVAMLDDRRLVDAARNICFQGHNKVP